MRNIWRYLIHSVVLVRGVEGADGTGADQYGEPLGTVTPETLTLPARVEWDNRRVVTEGGEEVVCAACVFLEAKYVGPAGTLLPLSIGARDRIIFEGRQHAIAKRNRAEGWSWGTDKASHWEVWVT